MRIDEGLLEFATEQQAAAVRAYMEHGTYQAAARALGICDSSYGNLIRRVRRKAAAAGYSPQHDMTKTVPEGYIVKGVSTYYDDEGKPRGQWVKSQVDRQKYLELVGEMIDELKSDVRPIAPVQLASSHALRSELLNFYVLADVHLGALSWAEETGADWDLDKAEQSIISAFAYLIEQSPPAETGFFCQLGDGLHYDGLLPVTPTHGHVVDADSRYHKVVRAAIRIFRQVVVMLLEKHEKVVVLHALGNHDMSGSVWLQESFAMLFENNPRCHVIVNPSPYYSYLHGKTFIGMHHGHKANLGKVAEVFSGRRYWQEKGQARQAYIHMGHEHHREVRESAAGIVEMHQTIAARSSHEAHGGYDADRSMTCITYHAAGKEHSRVLYYPEAPDEEFSQADQDAQGGVSAA